MCRKMHPKMLNGAGLSRVSVQRFIRRYGKTRANGDTRTDIDIPWVHFKPIMDEVMIVKLRIDLEF